MVVRDMIKKNRFLWPLAMRTLQAVDDLKNRDKGCGEIFSGIYKKHDWGGGDTKFYSGDGSYNEQIRGPYCSMMKQFLTEKQIQSVCDLGCGDFHVSSGWVSDDIFYIGVDVVEELVSSLNAQFGSERVRFLCRDITCGPLPDAQLCVIRQVMQHLSNEEIGKILHQVQKYRYVLITEHIVKKECAKKYNIDKVHGAQTRVARRSGVYLEEGPFCLDVRTIARMPYPGQARKDEELVTVLLENRSM